MAKFDRLMKLPLADETRELLPAGARCWGAGPAEAADNLAGVMGFTGAQQLQVGLDDTADRIAADAPISIRDLTQALLATEIAWASAVLGTNEWELVTGWTDVRTLPALRRAQRELEEFGVPTVYVEPFRRRRGWRA